MPHGLPNLLRTYDGWTIRNGAGGGSRSAASCEPDATLAPAQRSQCARSLPLFVVRHGEALDMTLTRAAAAREVVTAPVSRSNTTLPLAGRYADAVENLGFR
jgi:hypothetical protein